MKFKNTLSFLFLALLILLLTNACNKDDDTFTPSCDGSNPTYDADIADIINSTCNSLSCHGSGASIGDWTSYEGMDSTGIFDNGAFETQVLIDMTMPQGSATLSEAQLNLIQCWADNGFPEN